MLLFGLTLVAGCGGPDTSPTSSSHMSAVCRNYASSVTATTAIGFDGGNPSVDTLHITTSYNTATNQLSATGTGTFNSGTCSKSGSWSTTYGSVADFVDEVSAIPPTTRWTSQAGTVTLSGPGSPCVNRTTAVTTTNTFDSLGRLVEDISTGRLGFPLMMATSEGTTVYTSWDLLRRPVSYYPPAVSITASISYDDSARTRSIVSSNGFSRIETMDAFDSNGNPVRSQVVTRAPPPLMTQRPGSVETIEAVFVIEATTRVCR